MMGNLQVVIISREDDGFLIHVYWFEVWKSVPISVRARWGEGTLKQDNLTQKSSASSKERAAKSGAAKEKNTA